MTAPLALSLQFALRHAPELAARHRAALPRAKVARYLKAALEAGCDGLPGEFTVRIVDAEEGQALNRDYRHKDYATNVLTFDYSQDPVVAADLVLCAPVVEREAGEQGKPLATHYAHLLVHGALHAQGYDHETSEQDAEEMEALEIAVMAKLGFANPYR
ncbi:MAG: rRNA maturation RNase YbeY [Comamonas sp.]